MPKRKMIAPKIGDDYLEETIFSRVEFKLHVKRVALFLDIHEDVAGDVIKSYFKNVFRMINTYKRVKRKINIYGFFSIWIDKNQ